jgi:hypothetical protein
MTHFSFIPLDLYYCFDENAEYENKLLHVNISVYIETFLLI